VLSSLHNPIGSPAGAARDGGLWFVDWLQAADDPKFTLQPSDCPF
jgi:hypothetical protein